VHQVIDLAVGECVFCMLTSTTELMQQIKTICNDAEVCLHVFIGAMAGMSKNH